MLDTESYENADGYLEVPSCIESLANSGGQLRQLAHQAHQYYAKALLCYGYTSEPNTFGDNLQAISRSTNNQKIEHCVKSTSNPNQDQHRVNRAQDLAQLANNKDLLESISSLVQILPLLNELCSFIERCLVTIESTIKRITYYLNLASSRKDQSSVKYDNFQLTSDVRLDAIFMALMDLMFALINLDKTLEDHTNVGRDLNSFQSLVQKLLSNLDESRILNYLPEDDNESSRKKLLQLDEHIKSIGMTLGITFVRTNPSIFRQCVDRLQHLNLILDKDQTQAGFRVFYQIFEEFLIFYSDHLVDISTQDIDCSKNNPRVAKAIASILIGTNLIPTTYMNTLPRRIFGVASLTLLFHSIFQNIGDSKKVHRAINQAIQRTKTSNIVFFDGTNSHLFLDEFLVRHMPKMSIETKSFDLLMSHLGTLQKMDANLEHERLSQTTCSWLIKLKSEVVDYEHMQLADWPKKQVLVLDQGLKIASEISTIVRSIPLAQQCKSLAVNKHHLVGLYKLSILLESIKAYMNEFELFISTIMLKIEHSIRVQWRQLFNRLQKRQVSMKYSDRKMDLSFALKLGAIMARSELLSSNQGRLVQSICLSMLLPVFDQNELQDLNLLMDLMRFQFLERLESFTDCSHLYGHIPTIGSYYNHAFEEQNGATNEVNLLHRALVDVQRLFAISNRPSWSQVDLEWLLLKREQFLQGLSIELIDHFKNDYLDRICQELEIELRLQAHKDLYSSGHSENDSYDRNVYDFKQILSRSRRRSTTFYIFNHRINMNQYVEQYLNKVCYELTALAPHDWFSYDNMMNLAHHKYGLKFVNTQLPAQSLDSGLDLLDITRNLTLLASRYSYDLTSQIFVEKCSSRTSVASSQSISSSYAPASSSQLLNTIQSHHIAESIQTHGYGTLDSAVNCTYQTLKRLVNLFSRQISDDKLRAVLQKEHQRMVFEFNSGQKSSWAISFDKANRMAKQFRLNISILSEQEATAQSQNKTDLDSIRQTVTQIGNLLAFVRLIKNGALTSASKSVDYVPDINDLSSLRLNKCVEYEFADYETQATLLEAAKNFDQCLDDFEANFSPKTNYSKIIVNLFSGLLSKRTRGNEPEKNVNATTNGNDHGPPTDSTSQSEQNGHPAKSQSKTKPDHLELFFLVIPALTINYIDHLINCKERASSRSSAVRFGALLSDDGFAIGVAFLLTVLGQTDDYNKLDWLNQTCMKLHADIDEVETRLHDPKYEESLKQTSTMTLRRLNKLQSEYFALEHTLTCALLLFENIS